MFPCRRQLYITLSQMHGRISCKRILSLGLSTMEKRGRFDFLKCKNDSKRVSSLRNLEGILVEDLAEIQQMFGLYFHNIFAKYSLLENIVVAKGVCKIVVLSKVWSIERDLRGAKCYWRRTF